MTSYLVTGGAGFVGSALARRLAGDGHELTVLDDMSRGTTNRLNIPCRLIQGDIRSEGAVATAIQGCDAVIHCAYIQGTQTFYAEPKQVLDVAVRGITNVLRACESYGVGELLLVSSSEAYQVASVVPTPETIPLTVPDPLNPRYSYGGGKIISELMALAWQRTGVLDRCVIARPHNIFGADGGYEHVIPEFSERMRKLDRKQPDGLIEFPIQGSGEETRSFCYIDDCVDQLALLLEPGRVLEPASIFNVGTMDERSIADVAHGIASCFGREIKIMPGSLPKGSPPRRLPDMTKMERTFDYRPRAGFASGLAATVAWYKEHPRDSA